MRNITTWNQNHLYPAAGLFLTFILAVTPETSLAVEFNAGFGLGTAHVTESHDFDDGSLYNIKVDDNNLSTTIYGEMEFSPFMRMELGYLDGEFSTVRANSTGGGSFWYSGPVNVDYGLAGIKLGLVGAIPVTSGNKLKLILKGGLIHWVSVVTLEDYGPNLDDDIDSGIAPYLGIGLEIDVTPLMAVRLQHEQFTVDAFSDYFYYDYKFDYSNFTAGLLFRF